ETVPTEPEQASAERNKRNAVWTAVRDFAFADVKNGGEGGDSCDVVHEDSAAPHHVDEREVNENQPRCQKQHVSLEGYPVRECASDQRWSDDGEHHLVSAEDDHRDRVVRRWRSERDAAETCPVQVAYNAKEIRAGFLIAGETKRESEGPPQHRGPAHRDETLHHDSEYVLSSNEPAVKKCQPRRHQHHQARAQEHEGRISSIEM